jgi:hypothetical protein
LEKFQEVDSVGNSWTALSVKYKIKARGKRKRTTWMVVKLNKNAASSRKGRETGRRRHFGGPFALVPGWCVAGKKKGREKMHGNHAREKKRTVY